MGASQIPPLPAAGATPRTSISAAELHGPRPPASLSAVSRTYRADTPAKVAVFGVGSSAHSPVAAGVPHDVPLVLTDTVYLPMVPLADASCRGRYRRPVTVAGAPMSTVRVWGRGVAPAPKTLCQIVVPFPSRAFAGG